MMTDIGILKKLNFVRCVKRGFTVSFLGQLEFFREGLAQVGNDGTS
jgi:hypothetical protein